MTRFDDRNLYKVCTYDECDILTNILRCIAQYKRSVGQYWPRIVVINRRNRLTFGFGQDTVMRVEDWLLAEAIYMSLYKPLPDMHKGKRHPTVFRGKRRCIGNAFRNRRRYDGGR